jgi:glycosyltransferase involved in cell wall biosynthesis
LKRRILFIGNFLSKHRGTSNPSEKVVKFLDDEFWIKFRSSNPNFVLRAMDILAGLIYLPTDIIHVDVFSDKAFYSTFFSVLIGKARNKRVYLNLHGGKLDKFYNSNKRLADLVFKRADRIFTPSNYLKNFFSKKGYSIEYLPNSIEMKKFPFKEKSTNTYRILWVRAFSHIYNPELAIKVLHHVKQKYPEATLTMIGPDKGELQKVKQLIEKLNLGNYISILGSIPNDELYTYYHTHDVFLNTTSYESFGLAVLEAAASGIPIVSVPAGELPLLWTHDENILLAKDWDELNLTKEIMRLLEDPILSKEISRNARLKSEQYDIGEIKKMWIAALS